MAPKRNAREAGLPATAVSGTSTEPAFAPQGSNPVAPQSKASKSSPAALSTKAQNWDKVLLNIYDSYLSDTPQRTKLIDVFLAFLVLSGIVQFVYCVLAGNYPFNAFLSGFGATVAQFVLTASLRIQTTTANKSDFPSVSPERAFADYVVCSLLVHFFAINFIN